MTTLRPSPPNSPGTSKSSRSSQDTAPADRFDAAYYKRFYLDARTRVRSSAAETRLASFVFGYLDHLGVPVRRVVDLGCGLGKWRGLLAKRHPRADYTGVEYSPYLCGKYGWTRGSAADFQGRGRYDLVLCQSVIQYLGDEDARRAVANMARLCRGAVYLEIITKRDWRDHCDREATDGQVHLRAGAWYRDLLAPHFRNAGGGLFLPRDSGAVLYELESGWPD